jgi:glycosyltransferase involved in cell wall biosynthesis
MKDKHILILLPCHNEETSIAATINECKLYAPNADIVVIDNASTDRTRAEAEASGATVVLELRQGKGYAVQRGFQSLKTNHDFVLMIDGDNTYGLSSLESSIEEMQKGYDMIIGRRVKKSSSELIENTEHYRIGHQAGNFIFSRLFGLFFGMNIKDTLSGWRLMSPGFVRSFNRINGGFEIETELNAHAFLLKSGVKEIEVDYFPRGAGSNSKLSTYKDGFKILKSNLRLFRSERPHLAFSILAMPWFIFSLILIFTGLSEYWSTGLVPRFPRLVAAFTLFTVSSLLWVCGMILERIRINREVIVRFEYNKC